MRTRAEKAEIVRRGDRLRSLLKEFGATLVGFDPGVTATLPGKQHVIGGDGYGYWGEPLSFNRVQWEWLEPLLVELRDKRKAAVKQEGEA